MLIGATRLNDGKTPPSLTKRTGEIDGIQSDLLAFVEHAVSVFFGHFGLVTVQPTLWI